MKPHELFNLVAGMNYTRAGDHVDYAVKVFEEEKRVRLIFQQTADSYDWSVNFNFPVRPYKNQVNTIWLARGWANAYKSANNEIMQALIDAVNAHTDYDVEICGWSYGGAMSLIAAEDFNFRTGIKPIVTTFGGPKPLFGFKTRDYIRSCCAEIHQYCHVNDIVPDCPPLPGYFMAYKVKLGKRVIWGKFNPQKWHTIYGEEPLYE